MTKEDVLALLEKSDAPVSGEQMCRALGMTRAGVWKAIEALRADGFDIEAAPRRGYRLTGSSSCRRSTRPIPISNSLHQTARRMKPRSFPSARLPDAGGAAEAFCPSPAGFI